MIFRALAINYHIGHKVFIVVQNLFFVYCINSSSSVNTNPNWQYQINVFKIYRFFLKP